jgi:kinesin family protein 4/21/27
MGRPSTPGFSTAIRGGGASGLRPPSSLGGRLNDGKADTDNGDGDWITIVSKFHFVDLAGSERVSCGILVVIPL